MSFGKLLLAAACDAVAAHDSQKRQNSKLPFVLHPLHVGALLIDVPLPAEVSREDCVLAGILHHLLEDTATPSEKIRKDFGAGVARIVGELTRDPLLPVKEARQSLVDRCGGLSKEAKAVRLADRLDNLRDLKSMAPAYMKQYCDETRSMLDQMRGACPELEDKIERLLKFYASQAPAEHVKTLRLPKA